MSMMYHRPIEWKPLIVFGIIAAIIILYSFKWSTEKEQFYAGDFYYDELIVKGK